MLSKPSKLVAILLLSGSTAGIAYAGSARHQASLPDIVPPNANSGECYARVMVPAQYRTEDQTVIIEDGYEALEVTEPQLRARQEQVLIKEASVHYKVRQPTYRAVTENIIVRPAYEKLVVTRPQFSTVMETVPVSKPRLVWKRGNPANLRAQGYVIHSTADARTSGRGHQYGRSQSRTEPTLCGTVCEVWCLVEEPGKTVTYNRKVLSTDARVQRVPVEAKVTSITKQVVVDRGGVEEIPIPAKYKTVTIEEIVGKGRVRRRGNQPVYGTVSKQIMISPERYAWQRVACRPGVGAVSAARPATSYYTPSRPSYSAPAKYMQTVPQSPVLHQAAPQRHAASSQPRTYGSIGANSGGYTSSAQTSGNSYSGTPYQAGRGYSASGQMPAYAANEPVMEKIQDYDPSLPTYSEDYTKPPAAKNYLDDYESKGSSKTRKTRRWK